VQFTRFVGNAVQGEFGLSLRQVTQGLVADRRAGSARDFGAVDHGGVRSRSALGIPMGVYAALRRGRFASQVLK
jgi:peptide/nickel transport system permease protein